MKRTSARLGWGDGGAEVLVKTLAKLAAFALLTGLPMSSGCGAGGDEANPVWEAICEAICLRGEDCFQVPTGPCVSLCLSEFGNVPCKGNELALDSCVEDIGGLSCSDIDRGLLPESCDDICLCEHATDCDDGDQCTAGMCDIDSGECSFTTVADGVSCVGGEGTCQEGRCVMSCTEAGIRSAVVEGGGPYAFACDGPTTVTTQGEIVIDKDLILDGGGNLTVDADGLHRVFSVTPELYFPFVEFHNLTITGGDAQHDGGGIRNYGALTLSSCSVVGNAANEGGGISSSGEMTILDSIVSENAARSDSGGIDNGGALTIVNSVISENTALRTGGLRNRAMATVTDTTFQGNASTESDEEGGAISNWSDLSLIGCTLFGNSGHIFGSGTGGIYNYMGDLTMTNSTVSGNVGQGLYNRGRATIISCTLSGNTGPRPGLSNDGELTMRNTVINDSCTGIPRAEWISVGGNVESPFDTCGLDHSSDQANVSVEQLDLGPLQDNGGPTLTHLPGSPSSAIDAVPDGDCVDVEEMALTSDQRGEPRPKGPRCDAGAVEAEFDPCAEIDCDDGIDCTQDGVCNSENGMCEGGGNEPVNTPCDQEGGRFCDGSGNCVECNEASQCDDGNECTNDSCSPGSATCAHTPVENDTSCAQGAGTCQEGICLGQFPCTERGIRDAIAQGGGPHAFACNGPTRVVTGAEIVIDNNVTLDGVGNLTVDGNEMHRIFYVPEGVIAELRRFTISGGGSDDIGAAFLNQGTLAVVDTIVTGNAPIAPLGTIANGGTLSLINTVVSENDGSNVPGTATIHNEGGSLTLSGSTVSNNSSEGIRNSATATLTQSMVSNNDGTGIDNGGSLIVVESTVSQNGGPGIYNWYSRTATLIDTTVSDNATHGIFNGGILTLTNSTVSGNTGRGISSGSTPSELILINTTLSNSDLDSDGHALQADAGSVRSLNSIVDGSCHVAQMTSDGGNVESPGNTCGFNQSSDQPGVTPEGLHLGPLQYNGGFTLTQLPRRGSVAIDVIELEQCVDAEGEPLTIDQRGIPRPQGPRCDAGAVEVVPNP